MRDKKECRGKEKMGEFVKAGVFLGVLEQSGIMDHMVNTLAAFILTSFFYILCFWQSSFIN